MAINQKLKFSWGHIIAFLALIFISYVSFMGITYLTDGNFLFAGIGVVVIDIILTIFFIVPQQLKGTDVKFSRKIIFERILLFLAPFFFVAAMIPYAHFWTVFSNRAEVEQTFSESIENTKGMFVSYKDYANDRIDAYSKKLTDSTTVTKTVGKGKKQRTVTTKVPSKISAIRRANAVEALELQLLSDNYQTLDTLANNWIDKAKGATVWNVFMIGNIEQIESAIKSWNTSLTEMSTHKMQGEAEEVMPFTEEDESVKGALSNFESLHSTYKTMGNPTPLAIGFGVLLFFMLIFPYIIQRRNTKSIYKLIGQKKLTSAPELNIDIIDFEEREPSYEPTSEPRERKKPTTKIDNDNPYQAF